jgi:hypothetical protein
MPDLKTVEASEILKPDTFDEYKTRMAYFHDKLSILHHNIFFVQKIVDFPFDLFVMPYNDYFLQLVADNFLQMSILQITKLTTDNGMAARTLSKFNTFMNESVKPELLDDYRKEIKKAKVKPRTKGLVQKAKDLRDKFIAHSEPGASVDVLTFGEIKEITQELTKLFEAASFDTEYRYLILSYDPAVMHPAGRDARPDIERILDSIAKESPVLNEPERNPMAWPYLKQSWPQERLDVFNRYRRKCGLPEA